MKSGSSDKEEEVEALKKRIAELEAQRSPAPVKVRHLEEWALNTHAVTEELEKALHVTKSIQSRILALLPEQRQQQHDTAKARAAIKKKNPVGDTGQVEY